MSKTKKTVFGLTIGVTAVVAVNFTCPVALRYTSAGLGYTLAALGTSVSPKVAENAFRTEIADDHDSARVFVRNAFGAAAYDADPTNRDANTPHPQEDK